MLQNIKGCDYLSMEPGVCFALLGVRLASGAKTEPRIVLPMLTSHTRIHTPLLMKAEPKKPKATSCVPGRGAGGWVKEGDHTQQWEPMVAFGTRVNSHRKNSLIPIFKVCFIQNRSGLLFGETDNQI